jgi:AcrR family transcriptional regulator
MDGVDLIPTGTVTDGRGRILAAARQLFTRNGFTAVSMQQIADAASVNKATLYHHFADKEALFVEVLRQEFAGVYGHLNDDLDASGSLRSQMLQVAMRIFAAPQTDIGRLMSDLREHVSPERRTELMTRAAPPWESLTAIFARARASGEIREVDPGLLGRLFFVMIASQLSWSKFGGYGHPDEPTALTIIDILLDGVGADSATATANHPTADGPSD